MDLASLELAANEVPSDVGASPVNPQAHTSFAQLSDKPYNGKAGTDERIFGSADHSIVINIVLYVLPSADAAAGDYPKLRAGWETGLKPEGLYQASPSIGDQANEYDGLDAKNRYQQVITFQQGAILGAVLILTTGSVFDNTWVESTARAADEKIAANT